jgi:hypothetical protein
MKEKSMRNETHLKSIVFSIVMVFSFSACAMAGTYSGGFGTETEPYQIGTVSDWQELMATPADWDANFIMVADVNLQGVPLIPVGNDINYVPAYFKGVFDGNGHVFRNATINMPGRWHIGLFGLTDPNSQIRNLGVEDVNMNGDRDVAGLVGLSNGTITNCYVTGKVGLRTFVSNSAGLVGFNRGTISHCHAVCDVNGRYAGGLVGRNWRTISDSYANGTIIGDRYVGGLVGWNACAADEDGYADPNTDYIGTIARCYAKGSVTGTRYVGGLVGQNSDMKRVGCRFLSPIVMPSLQLKAVRV